MVPLNPIRGKTVKCGHRTHFTAMAAVFLSAILMSLPGAYALKHSTAAPETPPQWNVAPPDTLQETGSGLFQADRHEADVLTLPDSPETAVLFPIMVSVCGAVNRPDVYRFQEDRRVQDAIEAAGGLRTDADLEDINIAAKLMDNTSLYIPFRLYTQQDGHRLVARRSATAAEMNPGRYTRSGWTKVAPPENIGSEGRVQPSAQNHSLSPPSPRSNGLIHLNRASLQELQELPGIGPKTAEKIIAYREDRPFQRIEDLMEVHGIGDKKMEAVRGLVTLE